MTLGVAVGTAIDNVGLGLSLGLALGAGLGLALAPLFASNEKSDPSGEDGSSEETSQ